MEKFRVPVCVMLKMTKLAFSYVNNSLTITKWQENTWKNHVTNSMPLHSMPVYFALSFRGEKKGILFIYLQNSVVNL